MNTAKRLRLILGDQLNASHCWYKEKCPQTVYVIAELHQEMDYVKHHVQKICAFFAAMAAFAQALEKAGHRVCYLDLDQTKAYPNLPQLLSHLCQTLGARIVEYQTPDEWRLKEQLGSMALGQSIEVIEWDTEHFLLPFEEIPNYFKNGSHNRMESFYRKMRKRFNILMTGDSKPEGGQWNYDKQNRNKFKAKDLQEIPEPLCFSNDVVSILERLDRHNIRYFGKKETQLVWPVSRKQALALLEHFCKQCLPKFGTFQDAMTQQSEHAWSLYHSRLSFAINSKMLHPMQVIKASIQAFRDSKGAIGIAQVEGFVRQILGWREFVRGIYWIGMPTYAKQNALRASRGLPEYFWTGTTNMACMNYSLQQSLDFAFAHHIQRLMVIGNFCLLTGIDPDQVDAWYLGVYIDAIEWVEMPNTRGMSQFADHSMVATKPYAASGNYIQKMSDYCKGCHYQVKEKLGETACPFNSFYWHFMNRHRDLFQKNPRIGMVYRNWDRLDTSQQQAILRQAETNLANLERL